MHIVFLSFYSGVSQGGVETYVHDLANRLVILGNSVTVFQNGPPVDHSAYDPVSLKLAVDWKSPAYNSAFSLTDSRALLVRKFTNQALSRINQPVDIIIPTNGRWQSLLCRMWAATHRTKVIISGQSGPGSDDRFNLWTFPHAFVGLTDYQCSWAKTVNPFVSGVKIPNGVDLEKFHPGVAPLRLKLPHPRILNVAALSPMKRQELLVQAVAKTQASLLIVGQGALQSKLSQLCSQLLPHRFQILSVPHHQMPHVYTACDLFAYPTSPFESFGIAMLEALASGLPVVATDDPIRREIVGSAGWFADPVNPEEFAHTLNVALTQKPNFRPQDQAAGFSWEAVAQDYQKLCASLTS